MKTQSTLEIKWVELILISLLLLGGMGVWLLVERDVAARMQGEAPSEAQSQQDAGVPDRQAEVTLAEDEVSQVQEALVKERMSAALRTSQMDMLTAQHPQIAELASSSMTGIPLSGETTKSFLEAQAGLSAASGMVQGLEERLNTLVDASVTLTTTLRSLTKGTPDYISTQVEFDMTQQELGQVQAELVTQHMEVTRQRATLQALVNNYPQLSSFAGSGNSGEPISMPLAQALSTYIELAIQQRQSDLTITALEAQLEAARKELDERNAALYQAQNRATQDYQQKQEKFRLNTRMATLSQAALWVVLGIFAVGLLLQLTKKFHRYPLRPLGIIIAAGVLTAILFSYQAFEILGGAIAGIILFVIVLIGLSIYIRQMEKPATSKHQAISADSVSAQDKP